MDGHMEPSSLHYHRRCKPRFHILDISRNPGSLLGYKLYYYTGNEAVDLPKVDPPKVDYTSMSDICKVFENLHMQWMGMWSHHHCVITPGASPDLGNQQKSLVTAGLQTKSLHNLDPPTVDHTSMSDISNVYANIHMHWVGIWSHHHCIITAGARPDLGNQL